MKVRIFRVRLAATLFYGILDMNDYNQKIIHYFHSLDSAYKYAERLYNEQF